jgi:hypothetical protein
MTGLYMESGLHVDQLENKILRSKKSNKTLEYVCSLFLKTFITGPRKVGVSYVQGKHRLGAWRDGKPVKYELQIIVGGLLLS